MRVVLDIAMGEQALSPLARNASLRASSLCRTLACSMVLLFLALKSVGSATAQSNPTPSSEFTVPTVVATATHPFQILSPYMVTDGQGTIYLAYTVTSLQFVTANFWTSEIWLARSTDSGATWGTPQIIASGQARYPTLAIGPANEIYVSYLQGAECYERSPQTCAGSQNLPTMELIKSVDGGNSFSRSVQISSPGMQAVFPGQVATDPKGKVYALWSEGALQRSFSSNGATSLFLAGSDDGASFGPPTRVATAESYACRATCQDEFHDSRLAIGPDGTFHVLWVGWDTGQLFYGHFTDGNSFAPQIVDTNLGGDLFTDTLSYNRALAAGPKGEAAFVYMIDTCVFFVVNPCVTKLRLTHVEQSGSLSTTDLVTDPNEGGMGAAVTLEQSGVSFVAYDERPAKNSVEFFTPTLPHSSTPLSRTLLPEETGLRAQLASEAVAADQFGMPLVARVEGGSAADGNPIFHLVVQRRGRCPDILHNGTGDADGDGLCDDWEINGLNVDVNGVLVYLDLPGMGADPKHKDIFVQLDTIPGGAVSQTALNEVIAAFANAPVGNPDGSTGINLHVDNGPFSFMNPRTGAVWGDKSRAALLNDTVNLGNYDAQGNFSWNIFESEKELHFPPERGPVFHYAISEPVSILDADGTPAAGGKARSIPSSDFILAIEDTTNQPNTWVGGGIMHELGHNLGLHHGGEDNYNRKPNYLSIMNYAFAYSGLQPGHAYDYSRFGPDSDDPFNVMPVLDESHLDEALGLGTPTNPVGVNALRYQSVRYCPNDHSTPVLIEHLDGPIDWNCNGVIDYSRDVAVPDINGDNGDKTGTYILLKPYDDWAHLIFTGGTVGSLAPVPLPSTTPNDEPTPKQLEDFARFWESQRPPSASDTTPPITQFSLTPQANAAGWNSTDVTVAFIASDNSGGSGQKEIVYTATGALNSNLTVAGATASLVIGAEGTTTITYFSRDNAGNAEAAHTLVVRIDKTPPTITATRSPQANAHGWNNTDVSVSFLCSDALSGLAAGSPPAPVSLTTEGVGQSASGTCADVAGNSAPFTVDGINIDKTPPLISATRIPAPNSYGWNNSDVTISFQCSDSLSGIDSCTAPQVITSEGAGQARTGVATDIAGNQAIATVSNINIDKTPPTLACSASPNVLWPPNNKLVPVNTSVTLNDSLSGAAGFQLLAVGSNEPDSGAGDIVGWQVGTGTASGQLRATRLGSGTGRVYSFLYSGQDKADNTAKCSATVAVPHDQGHQ